MRALMRRAAAASLLLGLALVAPAAAADPAADAVKAAFVYNFLKLVSWPDPRLADNAPLQVCVPAGDPMQSALETALSGKVAGNHPVRFTALATDQDFAACHLLYLGGGRAQTASLMARVSGKGVLLVDDGPRFSWPDGMIRLFEEQGRMRFEINLQSLERSGLRVDPRLIRLARIATP